MVVYIFNFIDRSILGILVEPIKQDLGVSDTMMGFLGGIAFATFYTVLGIPIARLADRGSRRNVLSVCLALWSAATALCGFAANFFHLLLARIGVAVGEAGGSPPSHSMISDMFPPRRRATALSIYALGIPIGTMLGNLGGGWINEAFDWRTAFMVVGAPGILLALIVRFTLREPPRGAAEGLTLSDGDAPPVAEVFRHLWSRRSFRYMAIGGSLHAFVGYGVGYWIPAMFNRSHGIGTAEMGMVLFYLGFASIIGTLTGGYFGDLLGARDKRWYLWLPGLATLISVPIQLLRLCRRCALRSVLGTVDPLPARRLLPRPHLLHDPRHGRAAHAGARLQHSAVHLEHHRLRVRSPIHRHRIGPAVRLDGPRRRFPALGTGHQPEFQCGLRPALHRRRQDDPGGPRSQPHLRLVSCPADKWVLGAIKQAHLLARLADPGLLVGLLGSDARGVEVAAVP